MTEKSFLAFSGCWLLVASGAKVASVLLPARLNDFQLTDAVIGVNDTLLGNMVLFLELAIISYLAFGRCALHKVLSILWISSSFLIYHCGLWLLGASQSHCNCYGNLPSALGVGDVVEMMLTIGLPACFFIWGLILLSRPIRSQMPSAGTAESAGHG